MRLLGTLREEPTIEVTPSGPETVREPPTEEEALEVKPPISAERPAAWSVPEAFKAPTTWRPPAPTDEEPLEIKPPTNVARGLTVKLVGVVVATPLKNTELETFKLPLANKLLETLSVPVTVEEAAINPPYNVPRLLNVVAPLKSETPEIESVPDALTLPLESIKKRPRLKVLLVGLILKLPLPINRLEEALRLPLTFKDEPIEEEALEMKPPANVARGLTEKLVGVVVATPLKKTLLETFRLPTTLRPELKVVSPAVRKVPEVKVLPFEPSTKK